MNQVILYDASARQWLKFQNPQQIISTHTLDHVVDKLQQAETLAQQNNWYAAGFISYEAAPAFDPALTVCPADDAFPLLWFGLYRAPTAIDIPPPAKNSESALHWEPSISESDYRQAIANIKAYIAAGETYQVNYTLRLQTPFTRDPWPFFLELVQAQQANYAAYVDTGQFAICSASPELFFELDGSTLTSRPMKGTAARGVTLMDDEAQRRWLRQSAKNQAENVMIVDMIRNDMGRVAEFGSVRVPQLFEIEQYPTVWQMTSTVTAATDAPISQIMTALFPCASITGAPKPRTMQIIANLETKPRKIYTGCIGFFTPQRKAQFNVAIRTVLVDRQNERAEYGVGGGIVWDSTSREEYKECQTKAKVLMERYPEFSLLETILWTPEDGYFLLDYHLRRLFTSATYFNYPADLDAIQTKLINVAETLPSQRHRVRLLVARNGEITLQAIALAETEITSPARIMLSPTPVDSADTFLYHKTTHRQLYENAQASCPHCDDVLLWNERGEITETCIANVVVKLDGELVTPPVESGLLAGTFRAWLLTQGKIAEQVISIEDIKQAEEIYLINSVRKWREALLER